jgi:hypothetical protein
VISQLPQTGVEIVYMSVQSTTNKHPIFCSAYFFFFPFSPWTASLQQKTRGKKQTNKTGGKTKQNKTSKSKPYARPHPPGMAQWDKIQKKKN